jgi:hypothetical protein
LTGVLEALLRAVRTRPECAEMAKGSLYAYAERLTDEARRGVNRPVSWTPFTRAATSAPHPQAIAEVAKALGKTEAEARDYIMLASGEMWVNSRYQVQRHCGESLVYLSVKRIDQQPIESWRDLQRIKNELVGPSHEGVELYPAEDRKHDAANQRHVYVSTDPTFRFPFGYDERSVAAPDAASGAGQAAFEPDDPWNAEGVVA